MSRRLEQRGFGVARGWKVIDKGDAIDALHSLDTVA